MLSEVTTGVLTELGDYDHPQKRHAKELLQSATDKISKYDEQIRQQTSF